MGAIHQAGLLAATSAATAAGTQAGANMATFGQFYVEALKAVVPLIGAAMGVPMMPAPGGTNISNAGAVANEAGKIDAQNSAGDPAPSNVAPGGSARRWRNQSGRWRRPGQPAAARRERPAVARRVRASSPMLSETRLGCRRRLLSRSSAMRCLTSFFAILTATR